MQSSSSSTPTLGEGLPAPTSTPIGGRSVASPAMIRILLTPAHAKVTPDEFEMMAGVIRRFDSVRLSELPKSQTRSESIPSSSALYKMGEVHISFITSYDPSHSFLAPFNLHRQVLGVLGLSTLSSLSNMDDLEHSPSALRQLHPGAVVHRVFAFDTGASRPQTVDLSSLKDSNEGIESAGQSDPTSNVGFSGRATSGLVVFPAVRRDMKDVKFYLKTLLPEFISNVLDGLDTTVKGLQGKPLETPRETLDGSMNSPPALSPTSSKVIGAAGSAVGTAASRASSLFSSFSAEEKKSSRNRQTSQSMSAIGPMGAGRYAKIKADYYLLTGDLWNALQTYDNCMNLLGKERAMAGGQDAVWYGSALEGWAVARFLVTRMGGDVEEKASCLSLPLGGVKEKEKEKDKDRSEFQFHKKPWSDIAEAYSLALAMYSKCLTPLSYLLESWKSITPDTPRDYTHPLIHTSACLAYSRLLLAIWASGGWNGETFDQLLYGGTPPALAETTRPTLAVYTQHCTASGVQRGDIAAPASLSMTNSSTNGLKLLDQIQLFSSLASIFGAIGFARKETYSIRRLQVLVVSLIVSGIQLQKKETTMASQVIRALGDESQAFGTMTTNSYSMGAGENADSILVLALQICQTYGVNIQKTTLEGLDKRHILSRAAVSVQSGRRLSSPLINRGRASWSQGMSKIEPTDWQRYVSEDQADFSALKQAPHFGWTQQQILILKDTLGICEVLHDDHAMLFFASILLRDFWPFLSADEQMKLKEGIAKVQRNLCAKGQETLLEYWGPALILDDMQVLGQAEDVQQTSMREANETKRDTMKSGDRRKHRKTPIANLPPVLIDDEFVSFSVTLFNPLSISLEVESIRLDLIKASSVGPSFEAVEVTNVLVQPNSYHTLHLTGRPRGEGKLLLRGIIMKLPSCLERKFAYERTDGGNIMVLAKMQSDNDDRWTRTKQFGLEARHIHQKFTSKPKVRAEERHVALQVIGKVPRLLIQSTASLRNGSVVLLDGEEQIINLTLYNRSQSPADYIRIHFEDDLKTDMISLLAEGHLSPEYVYELEDELLNRPFMSMVEAEEAIIILPGEKKTLSLRIRGKLDVRRACVKVQYGSIKAAKELGRDHFYTRKAEFTFDVRVQPIIAIDGVEASTVEDREGREGGGDKEEKESKVMLGMRVHNLHNYSVTIDLQLSEATKVEHRQLAANTTTHIYAIIPKLSLSKDYLSQSIPNLIERQFIVSKVKQTEEESRIVKMRFWIRIALLKMIPIRKWTEDKTRQSGEIGLSGLHINDERVLSTLLRDQVTITTQFDSQEPKKHDFINFIATITNTSYDPLLGHYQLIPDVNERLVNHIQCTDGHLHGPLSVKVLAPGESSDIRVGLCFLASGTFAFFLRIVQEEQLIIEKKVQILVL